MMTMREVSAHLKMGEKTTSTTAQPRHFPSVKERGQWHFRCTNVDRWIA